jgi:hydroxyacylglutathione hydrolase
MPRFPARLAIAVVKLASFILSLILCLPVFAQNMPPGEGIVTGSLPQRWLSQGSECMEIPEWQVHEYNPNLFILRQSPCSDYEKPFIFLFFGKDRALLLDTGSENGNLAPALLRTIKMWLVRNQRESIPLVVVHTHEHGDHTAGDAELKALHDPTVAVTLIPAEVEATKRFYGITNWPEEIGHADLGGRVLDMIPAPGHSAASVVLYDRRTGILFSGDSLYPGRLYVVDLAVFQASIERLVRFTADKPVAHIIGNHVEQMSTPFLAYPVGTIFQPDEHELALSRGSLLELEDALVSMHNMPLHDDRRRLSLRDFSVLVAGPGPHIYTPDEITRIKAYIEEQKRGMWDPTSKP